MKIIFLIFIVIVSHNLSFGQIPTFVPSNGLSAWWPFTGNANDESGNGFNGQVNGAFLAPDRYGVPNCAYSFTNNSIEIGSIDLSSSLNNTICIWEKVGQTNNNGWQCLFSLGIDNQSGSIRFMRNGSTFRVAINEFWLNNQIEYQIGNSSEFIFYTFTIEPNLLKLFVNGILIDSLAGNFNTSFTGPLVFGYHLDPSFPYYFQGILDDIGIWSRVLTDQEIMALYQGCQLELTTQPQDVNVATSVGVANFSVTASNQQVSYQWQTNLGLGYQNISNAGQYSGANSNNLSVSNVTIGNNNQVFRCIVSDASCNDTSNAAILTIVDDVGFENIDGIDIYIQPNPNNGECTIILPTNLIGESIQFLSINGSLLFNIEAESTKQRCDLRQLSSGCYWVKVGNNNPVPIIKN